VNRTSAIIASSAANHSSGVQRQRLSMPTGGGNAANVAVRVAVHEAGTIGFFVKSAPFGMHGTPMLRFVVPFENPTAPVGPWNELLVVLTVAVSTVSPGEIGFGLPTTVVCVAACVMVKASVFEVAWAL